jgi:hypothetical protein
MWRRYGDAVYTLVTFAIFGFETLALGALSVSFLLGKATGIASTPVEEILFAVVTSTASALALLGLYLLAYHFTSAMRDRWQAERLDAWTEKWIGLALEFLGYRQLLAFERVLATLQVQMKKGKWGRMTRRGVSGPDAMTTGNGAGRLAEQPTVGAGR